MNESPQISVVIPAYNAAAFLAETLRSVAAQTQPVCETIVVDDGSIDETVRIAELFGATVIALENSGPSAARNAGIRAASGDFIAFLDADDVWPPEKLALQLAALRKYGHPAFAFSDYHVLDQHGLRESRSELRRYAAFRQHARKIHGSDNLVFAAHHRQASLGDSYILPSSVLARRADVIAVGGFDETLRVTEDYEFHLRLIRLVPAVAVMKPLLHYRRHSGQATSAGIRCKAGYFAVARLVEASPDRYSPGDTRYLARTEFLRHLQLGFEQARVGEITDAIQSFTQSLRFRPTLRAGLAVFAARAANTSAGRALFDTVRAAWKRRPKRGSFASN